jgi:hypothetical protein
MMATGIEVEGRSLLTQRGKGAEAQRGKGNSTEGVQIKLITDWQARRDRYALLPFFFFATPRLCAFASNGLCQRRPRGQRNRRSLDT